MLLEIGNNMKIVDKWKRLPYRLNRQPFNTEKEFITNLNLVCNVEDYFVYKNDRQRVELKQSIQIENKSQTHIIAHAYWYGEFGRKQAFSIWSYLATQDLNNTCVWLWLDEENGYADYKKNKYIQELLPYIEVKPYNTRNELKHTFHFRNVIFNQKDNLAYRADGFRLLVLNKYGGIYFDLDICFLNDMSVLCGDTDWCYSWEKQGYANNALLYMVPGSKSSLTRYLFIKAQLKAPMPWAVFNYTDRNLNKLKIYPFHLFDPAWLNQDGEARYPEEFDFFFKDSEFMGQQNISYKNFFAGAYTYHWHNRWSTDVVKDSFFDKFEKEFKEITLAKQRILYVEQ